MAMPKPKALQVFRTPIGFHETYVAAPTKKAALEAWGSHHNIFAVGEAKQVTEPKLMRAPLATPGVVVKVSPGSTAEQLKALPPNISRNTILTATIGPTFRALSHTLAPSPQAGTNACMPH
jgi:hypothetical protein